MTETNIDTMQLHAGKPVVQGQKIAFNIWFRERPVMLATTTTTTTTIDNVDSIEENKGSA